MIDESAHPGVPSLKSLGAVRRRAVTVSREALVHFGSLSTGDLPLPVEPVSQGVDLVAWGASKILLEEKLHWHGGILLRGFNLQRLEDLEAFVQAVSGQSLEYRERSSP